MNYIQTDTFTNFAIKEMNIGSHALNQAENHFYTPNILRESKQHMINSSVFDELAKERILFITGEVNDNMSSIVCAQLKYMDTISELPITFYINSPGGSVLSGLQIYDFSRLMKCELNTICTGMGASMGSILTGMGTKGRRGILPHARIMLHQASGGMQGNVQDIEINFAELKSYNDILFDLLGKFTGKDAETVKRDATRDFWLMGEKAVEYGIVDYVVETNPKWSY